MEINFGMIPISSLEVASAMIRSVYQPMLKANTFGYQGQMSIADKDDLENLNSRSVRSPTRPPPPRHPISAHTPPRLHAPLHTPHTPPTPPRSPAPRHHHRASPPPPFPLLPPSPLPRTAPCAPRATHAPLAGPHDVSLRPAPLSPSHLVAPLSLCQVEHFEKSLASLQLSTRLKELEPSEQVVCTPAAINAAAAAPEIVIKLEGLVHALAGLA